MAERKTPTPRAASTRSTAAAKARPATRAASAGAKAKPAASKAKPAASKAKPAAAKATPATRTAKPKSAATRTASSTSRPTGTKAAPAKAKASTRSASSNAKAQPASKTTGPKAAPSKPASATPGAKAKPKTSSPKASSAPKRGWRRSPRGDVSEADARKALKKFGRGAGKYRDNPKATDELLEKARQRLKDNRGPLSGRLDDILTLMRLVRAYIRKDYRDVPWETIALAIGALVYLVSIVDLIPDVIPGIGYVDDVAVIGVVVVSAQEDLRKFREWEAQQALDQA